MDNILTAAELNIIPVRIPAKVTADSADRDRLAHR